MRKIINNSEKFEVSASIIGGSKSPESQMIRKQSKQLKDGFDYKTGNIIEPPYSLNLLASFLEMNTWHYRCVKVKAISTAGLGFTLKPARGAKNPSQAQYDELMDFFENCNPDATVFEILENVSTDNEAVGNGYIEVVRSATTNKPKYLYHMPATTVRIKSDLTGYVQKNSMNATAEFRKFGLPDSDPASKDANGNLLNEVIQIKNYALKSTYYGLPDFLPALTAIIGNRKAQLFNIDFFDNSAVPKMAVIVEGGILARETKQVIENYFKTQIKGQGHKTLVIESPEGVKATFEKLSFEITDASFQQYRQDNADEIRSAHGVPARLIGLSEKGGLGGAGEGRSQQETFKSFVIKPKQRKLEYKINNLIIRQGFGFSDWRIKFDEIDIEDEQKVSEMVYKMIQMGVITVNEARQALGMEAISAAEGGELRFLYVGGNPVPLKDLVGGTVTETSVKQALEVLKKYVNPAK